MRGLLRLVPWLIALLVVAALLGVGWRRHQAREAANAGNAASTVAGGAGVEANSIVPPLELLPDDLATIAPRDLRRTLRVTGSLRAVSLATVKARVPGELRDLTVREGEAVRAGQVLGHIDTLELELRVRQANENVAAARGQYDIALKTRDNNKSLFERGFISATAKDTADAQLVTARATVDANIAALDLARKALADAEIRAPIAGTVAARLAQPGERLAVDARVIDIVDIRQLELEAIVPASDIARVAVGQEVSIAPEGAERALAGKVVRISPTNQTGTRAYLVYAQLPNPGERLRAGLFAQARIVLEVRRGVLAVPSGALRGPPGAHTVYLIDAGKVREVPVATGVAGDEDGGWTELRAGLAAGAQVVRVELGRLRPGMAIKVVAPPATATVPAPAPAAAPAPVPASVSRDR